MEYKGYNFDDPNIFTEIEKDYYTLKTEGEKQEFLKKLNDHLETNFMGNESMLSKHDEKGDWPEGEVNFLELLNKLSENIKSLN